MSMIIQSGAGADLETVNTNKQEQVNTGGTASVSGSVLALTETESGTSNKEVPSVSPRAALKNTQDRLVFDDKWFNGSGPASPPNANWKLTSGGSITAARYNNAIKLSLNTTALDNYAVLTSSETFSVIGKTTTFKCRVSDCGTQLSALKKVAEWGLFLGATNVAPTDGAGFRYDTDGALKVFLNCGGAEQTTTITTPELGRAHFYKIAMSKGEVIFYIDEAIVATINRTASQASPTLSRTLPCCFRLYNVTPAGPAATAIHIDDVQVFVSDDGIFSQLSDYSLRNGGQPSESQSAGRVYWVYYANSSVPASGPQNFLGGQWQISARTGAETDLAAFNGAITDSNGTDGYDRSLYVTDVWIDTVILGAAVATTPTVIQWAINVGSTSTSFTLTDSNTVKKARTAMLGEQTYIVGSPVGTVGKTINKNFKTPLLVNPGEYLQIIYKIPVGTATASQIIRGVCFIGGYFA